MKLQEITEKRDVRISNIRPGQDLYDDLMKLVSKEELESVKGKARVENVAKKYKGAAFAIVGKHKQDYIYFRIDKHDINESLVEGEDVWTFIVGEQGEERKTTGDAAKICKKILSLFKKDTKVAGEEKEEAYLKLLAKVEPMTDPAKLFKALLKADLVWDGYAVELEKNGKIVSKPGNTRY